MNTQQWLTSATREGLVSKDQRTRVISVSGGLWVAQRFNGDMASSNERDRWQSEHRATSKTLALAQAIPNVDDRP